MSLEVSKTIFTLPDILADWPWKRNVHPGSSLEVKTRLSAWIQSFIATIPRLKEVYERGDFYLLSSLAYPLENEDVFRVGCYLMNWFYFFDESTDIVTTQQVQEFATIAMDAMRNPDKARPVDEHVIGEATRQFWQLASQYASLGARRRFIDTMDKFTVSIVQQAQDRAGKYIRSIDEYFSLRRDTIGVKPSLVVLEFGLSLPDEVFEDPVIQRLVDVVVDMIILSNDICSYNVEQARGDDHNLVTILMHHENLDLDGAMKWIGDYASRRVQNFLDDLDYVPYLGEELQSDMKRYVDGLGNWVRANDCWNFECHRYFATGGKEIQQSRKVVLLPRSNGL